jgi:putative ATPase
MIIGVPKELKNNRFWEAQPNPAEARMQELMKKLWGDKE